MTRLYPVALERGGFLLQPLIHQHGTCCRMPILFWSLVLELPEKTFPDLTMVWTSGTTIGLILRKPERVIQTWQMKTGILCMIDTNIFFFNIFIWISSLWLKTQLCWLTIRSNKQYYFLVTHFFSHASPDKDCQCNITICKSFRR